LKWAFCGCRTDMEACAYVHTASYAPGYYTSDNGINWLPILEWMA